MKKLFFIIFIFPLLLFGQEKTSFKVLLLISEQNIEGPQKAWWASEIDLSQTEATLAKILTEKNITVIEPSLLNKIIKKEKAFRRIDISEQDSLKLADLANVDYLILGKAIASAGSNVANSNMRSCFANITIKVVRVKDKKLITYLDSQGKSIHLDIISGGKEALEKASQELAQKIISVLEKEREG